MSEKNQPPEPCSVQAGLVNKLIDEISKLFTTTPKSVGEMLWRSFAVFSLSSFLVTAWMFWKYPEVVRDWLMRREETSIGAIFRRRSDLQHQVMDLLGSFVREYSPTQIALIEWPDSTSVKEIWANESTLGWPTTTSGILSENMKGAVAEMIFEECWEGQLSQHSPSSDKDLVEKPWLICGIRSNTIVTGFVAVHWQGREIPAGAHARLDDLTNGIERALY